MLNSEKKYDEKIAEKLLQSIDDGKTKLMAVPVSGFPRTIDRFTGFSMMFDNLAKFDEFGEMARVFFYCLANIDFENYVQITQTRMAKHLDMKRQNVGRALKELEKVGVLFIERVGRQNFYRLNPEIAWRGKSQDWKKVVSINDFRERQTKAKAEAKAVDHEEKPLPL